MSNELIIGLGGLLLSVLTYFAGVRRTEKRHILNDRQQRVQRVFERYMEFRRTGYTAGYDGSLKAGVATLESNDELKEFSNLVAGHGEMHPLGIDHEKVFKGVDRLKFFRFASEERINLIGTPIEEAIARYQNKK